MSAVNKKKKITLQQECSQSIFDKPPVAVNQPTTIDNDNLKEFKFPIPSEAAVTQRQAAR